MVATARRKFFLQNRIPLFQQVVESESIRRRILWNGSRQTNEKHNAQKKNFVFFSFKIEDFKFADTSFVKNVHGTQVLGRNPTDRGRKATKVSLLTDKQGTPLCTVFHKANKNDCCTLRHLLSNAARKTNSVGRYKELLADKGYDSQDCRGVCSAFGLTNSIPHRRTRDIDRRRYAVEQTFGILDQFRRIRVRYDFKSFHYIAMLHIVGNR